MRRLTVVTSVMLACGCQHPARAALERGDLAAACSETQVETNDEVVREVNRRLIDDARLTLRVVPFTRAQVLALAPGVDAEVPARPTLALVRWTHGAPALLPVEVSWTSLSLEGVTANLFPEPDDSLSGFLAEPPRPVLEDVPAELLPRKYVEEPEPGRWVYRAVQKPADLMTLLLTGGMSVFFQELETELVERPETAAEKKARQQRSKQAQAKFEAEERLRLAKSRELISAIVARNQALLDAWEQRKSNRARLAKGLVDRAHATCPVSGGGTMTVPPGGACEFLAIVRLWGAPTPGRPATLEGRFAIGTPPAGPPCSRGGTWAVPLGAATLTDWDQALSARFEKGPVAFTLDASRRYALELRPAP